MLQRLVPTVARLLGVCAFISITMYSVYLNTAPRHTIICPQYTCPATEDFCLWGMLQRSSWMTLLAYLALYGLLAYASALVVERWLTYYYAERQTCEFLSRMADAIYGRRMNEARGIAAEFPKSPLAAVVNASLRHSQTFEACATGGIMPSMEARQQAIVIKTEELRRGLWSLSAVGWTVPLVGFLTLVAGVLNALQGYMFAESCYSAYLIRELVNTLWATIFSVLVGVPLIWFHKAFAARSERLLTQMERLSLAIIGQLAASPKTMIAGGISARYDTQPLDIHVTHRLRD
ncbi:MAG TPA: MotA/TolQ/ExbB proton channel family protein [Blastocatellia bacterium]|nr:MotA/TolQ/ExbB proton channel family protein [Blastocatellia bacterium]